MFEKVNKVQNVGHSFDIINNFLARLSIEGDFLLRELKSNQDCFSINEKFDGLGIYSDEDIYLSQGFVSKVLNINRLKVIDVPYKIETINRNRIVCSKLEGNHRFLISQNTDGTLDWKVLMKRGKNIFLDEAFLISTKYLDDSIVIGYDLKDGGEAWRYDVSELGLWYDYNGTEREVQISRILGVYKYGLFVYLNSGKILILDVRTGERIKLLENDKDRVSNRRAFGFSIELDGDKGRLIQLANQDLIEVDLNSGRVSQIAIGDMISLNLENFSRIGYDKDHILFTDKHHHKLGALNRMTMKIEWTYEFSQKGISESEQPRYGRELRLKDGRLYVLDNKNTLHIFKRHDQQM